MKNPYTPGSHRHKVWEREFGRYASSSPSATAPGLKPQTRAEAEALAALEEAGFQLTGTDAERDSASMSLFLTGRPPSELEAEMTRRKKAKEDTEARALAAQILRLSESPEAKERSALAALIAGKPAEGRN